MNMIELMQYAVELKASDLHMAVGRPPVLRINGALCQLDAPPLTAEQARRVIFSILNDLQIARLEKERDLDFSYSLSKVSRFRVNIHYQRGTVATAVRIIPNVLRGFSDLGLPEPVFEALCLRPVGLVILAGPTGSGKSTTLAAMIDRINSTRSCHIVTVEDPIEYLHDHKKSLVEQREINTDAPSFQSALKYVLRQDPDVILVGEMRDLETTSATVTAAETGHLVFSTLHTVDVMQTVDRIIDIFPFHQRDQIRLQLAGVMEAIICQRLLLRSDGKERVPAVEIMLATDAIRSLIREGKTHQLESQVEAGRKYGMQTMTRALLDLCANGKVSREEALMQSKKPEEFQKSLDKMALGGFFSPSKG